MERLPSWIRQHVAALRAVIVLTVILGVVYPLVTTGVAQAVFNHQANGSMTTHGSELIGQSFEGHNQYFQSRPSAAGDGYDTQSTAASNLGPEDVLDTKDRKSLLTQVCARSKAVGELEGVSGARPYCTDDGVGAVLKVFKDRAVSVNQACPAKPFLATYEGLKVECAKPGEDYAAGKTVPVRGGATAVVPADAVTASGSGLDPHISVAYAELQAPRIARERKLDLGKVKALIQAGTTGRALGFMGEPAVNVLQLNLALDRR
ncbi:potassium-transporting ATPase subunit C [Nonomuraea sp. NPDC050556]|uniref:potassium-transporting ATPase subunit C n=1 Tax=Nonomuraea sp. NPDC050556 TaxID=3364369 RepID=UPI0037A4F982